MTTTENLEHEVEITPFQEEIKESYASYALFVATSRAFPAVEDGLKPVQRRLLYAMFREGFRSDRDTVKSAKPVAATMGDFHPHGDSSIYDALVRLAQPWKMGLPLIISQGNWGSQTTSDPAAAMRYTECTMDRAAEELLDDIKLDTVPMVDTYDAKNKEPVILPARIPNLLVNGSSGVGVGFACSFACHNLAEVCTAVKAIIDNPSITLDELMEILPAPDFPTGANIIVTDGIKKAYETGNGAVKMRAKYSVEAISARTKGIVFSELPYGVKLESVTNSIQSLQELGKLSKVSYVSDESELGSVRYVVALKSGADAESVVKTIFANTQLETNFNINSTCLADGYPQRLPLLELIKRWIEHRINVLERKHRFLLQKALDRLHLVEGFIKTHENINEIVNLIKTSKTAAVAAKQLKSKYELSSIQAEAVLEMQLRRLANLELDVLKKEKIQLESAIKEHTEIVASDARKNQIIKDEQDYLIKEFAVPRKTTLVTESTTSEAGVDAEESVESASKSATSAISAKESYDFGLDVSGNLHDLSSLSVNHAFTSIFSVSADNNLRLVTADGDHYLLSPKAIAASGHSPSDYLDEFSSSSNIVAVSPNTGKDLFIVTKLGVIKRVKSDGFAKANGATCIAVKPGDAVLTTFEADDSNELVLLSSTGKLLRTSCSNFRAQGRTGGGVAGMKLPDGAEILAASIFSDSLLGVTLTDANNAKAYPIVDFPAKGRNTGGVQFHPFRKAEKTLVAAALGTETPGVENGDFTAVEVSSTQTQSAQPTSGSPTKAGFAPKV